MMGDDAVGSSTQEPPWPMCCPGASRSADAGKDGIGFYLSGHLFDEVEAEVRRFVRTPMAELATAASRRCWPASSAICASSTASAASWPVQAGRQVGVIEASGRSHAQRPRPAQGRRVWCFRRLQPDRFSGGLREGAAGVEPGRCALPFGRYLQVSVGERCPMSGACCVSSRQGRKPSTAISARAEGAPGVRCQSARRGVRAAAGRDSRFFPAMRRWPPGMPRRAAGTAKWLRVRKRPSCRRYHWPYLYAMPPLVGELCCPTNACMSSLVFGLKATQNTPEASLE
jgi:DNA polymerase-3 subunit alpha